MKVIIAEKPDAARDIASVVGANEKRDGYQEGNGYKVTWAFGHICQLAGPEKYGFEKWAIEDLPIIPEKFKLVVDKDKSKQLQIIKSLFEEATEIINATDAGREGELIFRYIYQATGVTKNVSRLWAKDLTAKGIEKAFKHLIPGKDKDPLYLSGKGRSEADWLVGMNATRSLTLAGGGELFSIGRVQTPTLALICKRYLENKSFKPVPYFLVKIKLEKDNKVFTALYDAQLPTKEAAESIKQKLAKKSTCISVKVNNKEEQPPLLYDITELQKEASKKFGFSPEKTLTIAQELYEKHKVLSYPRTGSRYITDEVYNEIPNLLDTVSGIQKFKSPATNIKNNPISKRPVNNEKVTDHHALLPTTTNPSNLAGDNLTVYDLVVTRFLAAFSAKCIKEITHLEFDNAGHVFKSEGTVIKEAGWRSVEIEDKGSDEDEQNSDIDDQDLPIVEKGNVLDTKDSLIQSLKTKPKPILDYKDLLTLMQTAGKELDDSELRKIMSSKENPGIGTGATRSNIIKTLFDREYIVLQKKKIVPTDKGLALYNAVKDMSIASPEMTAKWEKELIMIENGEYRYADFMQNIKSFTTEIVAELLECGQSLQKEPMVCPKCSQKSLKENKKAAGCQNEACDFVIYKEIAGKILSSQIITDLVNNSETSLIKGFKNKDNKSFDAYLFLDENKKVSFKFSVDADEKLKCPKCQGGLQNSPNRLMCNTECGFVLYKKAYNKDLSDTDIKALLDKKETKLLKGLVSASDKTFDAKLKLDQDFKVKPYFENSNTITTSAIQNNGENKTVLLGEHNGKQVQAGIGKFGVYVLYDGKYTSVKDKALDAITLQNAIDVLTTVQVKEAPLATYGKYKVINTQKGIRITDGEIFCQLPKGFEDYKKLTTEECKKAIDGLKEWIKKNKK